MCKLIVLLAITSLVVLSHCAPATEENKKDNTTPAPTATPTTTTAAPAPTKKKHQETFIEITYGAEKIVLGNFLNASQLKYIPALEWKTEENTLYTLAALNLDVPTKKNAKDSDFLLWLVGNIPGNDISKGDTLAEYIGAFPLKDEGTQNVMFILNEQPKGRIEFTEQFISKTNGEARKNFDINKFARKYGFGIALAFNSLKAEYDEYADELRKQLFTEEKKKPAEMELKMETKKSADPEPEMEMKCVMVSKVKDAVKEEAVTDATVDKKEEKIEAAVVEKKKE